MLPVQKPCILKDRQGGECANFKESNNRLSNYFKMPIKANNESSAIFSERIGNVSIKMMLDIRNRKERWEATPAFPLCIRFVQDGKRLYYRLGEQYTEKELKSIRLSTGFGEQHEDGKETRFQTKMRLNSTFMQYVGTVQDLSVTGKLTLERINTALTGKSKDKSLIGVWEEIIQSKLDAGKIGTASSYSTALHSFRKITKFSSSNGFTIDSAIVRKWQKGMEKIGNSQATIGINLRALRFVINTCISEGYLQQKDKLFGRDVSRKDKISIPVGTSRKDRFLSTERMCELFSYWQTRTLPLPIYKEGRKDNPSYAVKSKSDLDRVYMSLGLFLAQYLCCGCNLTDLSSLRYDDFYFDNNGTAFRFVRQKTSSTAHDGDGTEVIVPVTNELKVIIQSYSEKPVRNHLVFPMILGKDIKSDDVRRKDVIKQQNHNIGDHMKKIAAALDWAEPLSSTYARHSFATNLFTQGVPKDYISDAMGHTIANRGDITSRYISPYTIEKRMEYNSLLLSTEDRESLIPNESVSDKSDLLNMLGDYSVEELQHAIIMLQAKKISRMENK